MSSDHLSPEADRLASRMQPHDDSRSPSPSDHDDTASDTSRVPSSNDPYYTNDDIAVLHAVVVAAQQILDSAPEPKPLPAAALFKAYDAVLPSYGIDPDDDHHLSTFVFRIGGERGDGNLVEKFQAILHRMGIVLEFGDNSSESSRISHQTSSPHSSFSRQQNGHARRDSDDITTKEVDLPQPSPILPIQTASPDVDHEANEYSEDDPEDHEMRARVRRAALSSVLGRWRSQALRNGGPSDRQTNTTAPTTAPTTTSRLEEPSYLGRYSLQNGIDHEMRSQPLPNIIEEVTEEAKAESVPQREEMEEASANLHQDSLRSLLDAPRPTNAISQLLSAVTTEENHDASQSLSQHQSISPIEKQPQGDRSAKNTMQGVFSTAPPQNSGLIPSIETDDAQAPVDNEQEELTERAPVVSPEPERVRTPDRTPIQSQREPDTATLEARHHKLLKHAARARELYLASKVFNHWADRTARRLEREAVARRHMIRFRYFRLWSQVPASRGPTIEQMKASVAVKKWQRIATQDDDLDRVAQEATENYRRKIVGQVLDQWSYQHLQHVGRHMTASRTRTKALANWKAHISESKAISEAAVAESKHWQEWNALAKWRAHTKEDKTRALASKRVGTAQQIFSHLREWWDQAELSRRAVTYHQQLLTKKACFAFDQWNLRARAQAFLWRREYLAVIRASDKWCRISDEKNEIHQRAERHFESRTKSQVLRSLRDRQQELTQLAHLQDRALLYIRGTRLLEVFGQAIKQRKDRDRKSVKMYLMARYTQMSSARKKRNFFSALDKWRAFTAHDQAQARGAYELGARYMSESQIISLHIWRRSAEMDERSSREAWLYYSRGVLGTWKDYYQDLEQRDMEAWQLWAAERQRNCLKEWSIASLQQSGQAHTATEVRKKHEREKRNRYMQHWRQLGDRPKPATVEIDSLRASTSFPQGQGSYRSSWRALSGRRSVIRRNDRAQDFPTNVVETPTRWTGQPTLMTSIMPGSSMAPLREVDEDAASSITGDDAGIVASPSKKAHDRRAGRFFALSSTTPRAPVPSYLEQDFQDSDNEPEPMEGVKSGRTSQGNSTRIPQRTALVMPTPAQYLPELENDDDLISSLRPLVPTKPFGYRPMNDGPFGLPSNPQSRTRAVASKSFGAKPSGLRYGVGQLTGQTPSTKSVRIQSPKSFSVTTPRPFNATRPERHQRNQQRNHNATNG